MGTLSIGEAGARNAALLAASIVSLLRPEIAALIEEFRSRQTLSIKETPDNNE